MQQNNKFIYKQILILSIGFLLIMLSVGLAQQTGSRNSEESFQRLQHIITQNNKKFVLMTTMREVIRSRILALYDLTLNTSDAFEIDEKAMDFSYMAVEYIIARDELIALGLSTAQLKQLEEQKNAVKKAQLIFNAVLEDARQGKMVKAATKVTSAREANQAVLQDLHNMRGEQQLLANNELIQAKKSFKAAQYQIRNLTISAFILSLAVIGFVIYRITSQAKELNKALVSLADSNLNLEKRVEEKTQQLMSSQQNNMRLTAEVDTSRKLQKILLPSTEYLNAIPNIDIAAYMDPASEVGGDYYDVLYTDNKLRIGIGDVTGHGLESGVVMLMAQCLVRAFFNNENKGLIETLIAVNQTIYENVGRMDCEKNMSLALLDYQIENENGAVKGVITLSGQHESIIIVRKSGEILNIDTDALGFPIGLIDNIEQFVSEKELIISKDDVIVLYTDGITEAANPDQNLFGLAALQQLVRDNRDKTAEQIKDAIVTELTSYVADQTVYDDITLIVIKQLV